MTPMILTGDENTPAIPLTDAQVNHLRRLLAWMRVEYTLDENMQLGYLQGAASCLENGSDPSRVAEIIREKADRINYVPAYLRQGIKMLTKALREHEKQSGIVDTSSKGAA